MKRREFLIGAASAAAFASIRTGWAQDASQAPPTAPANQPGVPAQVDPAKLARISIMTLNFSNLLKLPGQSDNPARTLELFDLPQMFVDVYGVHNIEFQHSHIPSTEPAYLKDLRAQIEKCKSRMTQINLEFGSMNISAADPVQRVQAIDLTKRWVDHALILGCGRVMVNQGQPTQENKQYAIETLKTMGDYAKSKGVKVSMETRGGGGGRRGGAPGAAAAAGTPPPPAPVPAPAPAGPPAWVLLKEIIVGSGTYSNIDIGGVGAPNQEALHAAIKELLPTSSGQMHIKLSQNWDLPTAIKYNEGLGFKGLYVIELNGHDATRGVYNTILANI
jgi:Xylose isomerase-like TIM barrel